MALARPPGVGLKAAEATESANAKEPAKTAEPTKAPRPAGTTRWAQVPGAAGGSRGTEAPRPVRPGRAVEAARGTEASEAGAHPKRRRRHGGPGRQGAETSGLWKATRGQTRRPAAGARPVCACPDPGCVVPGAHPFDPGLLAATTDARMVRWWWTRRPDAPVLLATGGHAPCAVSLPAAAGARALAVLDQRGLRVGPVVATPTRWSLLVAPYGLERLGELLYALDTVPSSLRFHGPGGYLVLPPSQTGTGGVRWGGLPSRTPRRARAVAPRRGCRRSNRWSKPSSRRARACRTSAAA